jgi:hypothetical protein
MLWCVMTMVAMTRAQVKCSAALSKDRVEYILHMYFIENVKWNEADYILQSLQGRRPKCHVLQRSQRKIIESLCNVNCNEVKRNEAKKNFLE